MIYISFIKLDRKLLSWEWKNDPHMVALWIEILLQANYSDSSWRGQEFERGSFPTSIEKLAVATGLTKRQTRTCLERLKTTHEIAIETTNRGSKIIVNKWADYQLQGDESGTQNDKPNALKRHANDTPNDNTIRNKEIKEVKEIKNINKSINVPKQDRKPFQKPTIDEIKGYCIENGYDGINAEKFYQYYEKNDWTVKGKNGKRKKMSNWKLCLNSWVINEIRYDKTNDLKNRSREAYIKDVEMRERKEQKAKEGIWFE